MKKLHVLYAALLAVTMAFIGGGCDEVKDAVTDATANQWYKYTGTSDATATVSGQESASTFGDVYVYYTSSTKKLKVVALSSAEVASNYYISYETDVSETTWDAGAVTLHSKVTTASDPTSGKAEIETGVNWGNIASDAIVNLLLGE